MTTKFQPIDTSIFPPERETKLREIKRYRAFDTFLYRSSVWQHIHRVLWILEEMIPIAEKQFEINTEKARALVLMHDDPEMITGDIPAHHKSAMTGEQKKEFESKEREAHEKLSIQYPRTFHGFSYRELGIDAIERKSMEAQLMGLADKVDALCECTHEVLAGNLSLLPGVMYYVNSLTEYKHQYPKLSKFLNHESPLISMSRWRPLEFTPFKLYSHLGKPHTRESILIETGLPYYNAWRKLVIERGGEEGIEYLTSQQEFFLL